MIHTSRSLPGSTNLGTLLEALLLFGILVPFPDLDENGWLSISGLSSSQLTSSRTRSCRPRTSQLSSRLSSSGLRNSRLRNSRLRSSRLRNSRLTSSRLRNSPLTSSRLRSRRWASSLTKVANFLAGSVFDPTNSFTNTCGNFWPVLNNATCIHGYII